VQGIPAGRKFTIGGVPCYVVEPRHRGSFQDKALLLIPDATGGGNPETQLLASESISGALASLLGCPETTVVPHSRCSVRLPHEPACSPTRPLWLGFAACRIERA